MGKKLIIKGADFSENGMIEEVITLDKSALYNNSDVEITSSNLSSQTNADRRGYMTGGVLGSAQVISNNGNPFYGAVFDVEDYETLVVNMANMPGIVTPTTPAKYTFGIGFANESNRIIKAYGPTTSEATGDWYVKVDANFSGEIPIPTGTKYVYISDIIADAAALATHSVVLKKVVVE